MVAPQEVLVPEPPQAKPRPFPHHYEVDVEWRGERGSILSAPPRPEILGGPPAQFGGHDEWWSPEHLLLSAVSLCLMATFQSLASHAELGVRGYHSVVKGLLDRTPDGLAFTSIVLHVDLQVAAADLERAAPLLERSKRHCIVANALRVPVDLRPSITPVG